MADATLGAPYASCSRLARVAERLEALGHPWQWQPWACRTPPAVDAAPLGAIRSSQSHALAVTGRGRRGGAKGTRPLRALSATEKVRLIVAAAEEKKARDLIVLDMTPVTLVADAFVICSGGSTPQVQAIADGIEEALLARGERARAREGYKEARWICLDYGDVVAHVFQEEARAYYDLERLWGDAPRLLDAVGGRAVY